MKHIFIKEVKRLPLMSPKSNVEKKETDKTQDSDLSKKSRTVERSIEKLEKEITRIEHSFADLEYGTPAFAQAEQKLLTKQQQLEQLMTEWEALHE